MRRALAILALGASSLAAADLKPADVEFFESKIRPVLVAECYECHDAKKQKGDLRLDYRDGLLKGGEEGPSIIPGDAKKSILLQSMDHTHETLQMPKKRTKLDAQILADFAEWINRGAPDPRTKAPEDSITPAWSDLLQVRRNWWSFQPITSPAVPAGKAASPIDRFLDAKIVAAGITPSAAADKATLLRRATYVLTGLPPSPAEIAAFEADSSPDAFAKVVDRLLASPRYGEHFARHWMDLVRYADSSGSEGDPVIKQAWRYRDYLIRAFNADVPYDQFVREQLAGDLLKKPRVDPKEGVNESSIGPGHFRLIEYGYQPLDTSDEQVKNVDNQIDVVSKTFLGLTVSCARCHDHKFDAISQADFTAFYGIFASTRPAQVAIDSAERLNTNRAELISTKSALRTALAKEWANQARTLAGRLATLETAAAEYHALKRKEQAVEEALSSLEFRARLQAGTTAAGPTPSSWWTFEQDGKDLTGKLPAKLEGGAVIRNGRLILDGEKAFASTSPLSRDLQAKTLEAWVALSTLDQKGGGVVTVETISGGVFDSVVFAEKQKSRWMAGSDNGKRTRDFNGPAEDSKPTVLIHLALVTDADNRVTLYRNGKPYGTSYVPEGDQATLRTFGAGKSRLLFGRRHTGPANAFLKGEIEEARLYTSALTAQQVEASFRAGVFRGRIQDVARKLTPAEETERQQYRTQIAALQAELRRLTDAQGPALASFEQASTKQEHPLHAWTKLREAPKGKIAGIWSKLTEPKPALAPARYAWDLTGKDAAAWFRQGNGFSADQSGDFIVEAEGAKPVRNLLPSGAYGNLLANQHSAMLTSPRFKVDSDYISVRVLGGGGAHLRLITDNYPIGLGGPTSIFPSTEVSGDQPRWIRLNTAYRRGSYAYIELTVPEDITRGVSYKEEKPPEGRAWFGIQQVVFHNEADLRLPATPMLPDALASLPAPDSAESYVRGVSAATQAAAQDWGKGQATPRQLELLNAFVKFDLLTIAPDSEAAKLVAEYRRLEAGVPEVRRAPGVIEADSFDQALFVRGDNKKPAGIIPRRYLEAFDTRAFVTQQSGRLELAEKIASPDNPLTSRVMVNRLWHHVFGRGLVGTVDNFGRLGDQPSHPELLDYLAKRLVGQQWSVKAQLRELLLTDAFRRSSQPTASALAKDADNALLSRARVRRLGGEALRDSLITLAGRMEHRMYGPGDNAMGAPHQQVRRSVYLNIRRNSLSPLITTFDGPKPFTTIGRRDATNVPAQSLTLLNSPFVIDTAKQWARTLDPKQADAAKVDALFVQALARKATPAEQAAAFRYLADLKATHADKPAMIWPDFAQSVLNLKEFLYLK
jgi:cytochrome c553